MTNRRFVEGGSFDGFRLEMAKEFDEAWIVDLGGDVRANPRLSGTTHNVFGIQTGVAISFWLKKHRDPKSKKDAARVHYARRPEMETADDKLGWLSSTRFNEVAFEPVTPDAKGNWINQTDNDFDSLLPLVSKETKQSDSAAKERALFKLYSNGVNTARDEWVYDDDTEALAHKAEWIVGRYNRQTIIQGPAPNDWQTLTEWDASIKWSEALKSRAEQGRREPFAAERIHASLYRPFVRRYLYDSELLIDRLGAKPESFPNGLANQLNRTICYSGQSSAKPFQVLAAALPSSFDLLEKTQYLPLYRYDAQGNRHDNLTDWGVAQFEKHYGKRAACTRERIFAYVYAVLHHPAYREKYALNLKRELPRVPLYGAAADFKQWADWGEQLLALHTGFETVAPFALKRRDLPGIEAPKCKLKADKPAGRIEVDAATTLSGIPPSAWDYKLGNRSALEWVLDQYKEGKPRDPTIAEHFNSYRFADYKEHVIELLMRVTTVSVETIRIVNAMPAATP